MDKKTILGIVVVAALFLGFAYFNTKQQEKYQQEMAAYQAYQDSVAAATRPVVPVADSTAVAASDTAAPEAAANAADAVRRQQVAALGEYLAGARDAEAEEFTVENDVMIVTFSTRGGRITGVTLKDYTKYAPRGKRDQLIELMDPASARFDLSFYVKNGLNNVKVNTMDYVFRAQPEQVEGDARRVVMRLPVAADAWLEYEYLIYNKQVPERDYLVDFNVRLVNMAPQMANQASIGIDWSNNSYQNEKGFQNENMYTTISYRFPGESSIEDLGMSEKSKSKSISTSVNWVAFKQQFFSSAFIAPQNVTNANLAFDTAAPGSELLKSFSAQMTVPYTVQTEGYDFAFYFGPNKYAILKKVAAADGEELHMERLIPLGWGIFGWVNRWCVIPVFDFLRNYIASFGIIILILVILVKLVISPLTYKSYVSMAKMRLIKPQVDELNKKYPKKEDAMKKTAGDDGALQESGHQPHGRMYPHADPDADPDRHVPFLPGFDRAARTTVPLGRRPFVVRQHREPAVLDPVLRRPCEPFRLADGRVAVRVFVFQLPADGFVPAPDGRYEVHDGLHDADHDAVVVQQLFERPLLLLPAVEPLYHRPDVADPPHGRRR